MKKIFTLLFSVGIVGTVFAQSGRQDRFKVSHDVAFNKAPEALMYNHSSSANDTYMMGGRDKDRQINQVNRDFDRQIMAVRYNRHLRPFEKQRQIRFLEAQKDQKIREIMNQFSY